MRFPILTVFALLAVGAVARFVFVATHPPVDHHLFEYETIAPMREQWWLLHFYGAGFGFILAFGSLAILTVIACRRTRVLATVGGVIATLGAILTALGFAAEGVTWAYATDPKVIDPDAGAALLHNLGEYPAMIDDPILTGFLLIPIGVLLQLVALWIARAVPRWLVYTTLGVLVLSQLPLPTVVIGVTTALEALVLIALGALTTRTTLRTVATPEKLVVP